MALNLSPESQLVLFKGLFGVNDPVTCAVADLVKNGAKVETALYVVKILYNGKTYTQSLTVGTSALLKGTVSESLVKQNKFLLRTLVSEVIGVPLGPHEEPVYMDPGATVKMAPPPADWLHKQAPKAAEQIDQPTTLKSPANQFSTDDKVVKLCNASLLGQKVEGTSPGAVYRVVALNPRVKVAAKIVGQDISVRVECKGATATESEKVKQMVSWKGSYGSLHLSAGTLPVGKVLGSLLFSADIEFDQMIHGSKDLEKIYG